MLSWFRKKRPVSETTPQTETATPSPDETGQEIAVALETIPEIILENATEEISETAVAETMNAASEGPPVEPPTASDDTPPLPEEYSTEEKVATDGEESRDALLPVEEIIFEEDIPAPPAAEKAPLFATPQTKPARKTGFFSRLAERLSRTRESFTNQLDDLLYGKKEIDRDLFDKLEELLITADLGYATTQEILDAARQRVKHQDTDNPRALRDAIRDKMLDYLTRKEQNADLAHPKNGPFVVMAIGVNGVGKTTTIGKIAHKFSNAGYSVLLVAADTFRAAAVLQLKIWGERGGIHVMAKDDGSDPSSVVFDALAHAVARNYDVVLVDTAGRLHTQQHLMEELKKIKRVMAKKLPGAPHEVLLVLDATTGQNAIAQARIFNDAVGVTGIALTKLDGTAKGGIVINVSKELEAPIRFIGVGEQLADLRDFDAREFIDALFDGGSGRKS